MHEYQDIRLFMREGRRGETEFRVTVWAKAGKYVVEEIHAAGNPPEKFSDGEKFETVDAAFETGFARARGMIDGLMPERRSYGSSGETSEET